MASSAITRAYTIAYGGVTVGTGTVYQLHGVHIFEQSYTETRVVFDVLVQNTTLATFISNCNALEAAYRTPNGDLTIAIGGSNHVAYTHAGNTAFNAVPSITKAGSDADSNASRLYTCSVTLTMPADESGKAGRLTSRADLTADESGLQTLAVSATYTALAGNDALTQAQAQFPTFAAGIQPSVTGDWDEATALTYSYDDENKICECAVVYREITHAQSASGTNDTSLVGERITVTTTRSSGANDTDSVAEPLVTVQVAFDTAVRVASSTDLDGKWQTLRTYLKTVAETQSGVTGLTVLEESKGMDPSGNRLTGTLTLSGADGSSLIASNTVTGWLRTSGKIIVPVANGDPLAADVHEGPALEQLVIVSTILELDTGGGAGAAFKVYEDALRKAKGDGYIVMQEEQPVERRFVHTGMQFSSRLPMRQRQRRVTLRKVNQARKGAQRSSGTRTRTRADQQNRVPSVLGQ